MPRRGSEGYYDEDGTWVPIVQGSPTQPAPGTTPAPTQPAQPTQPAVSPVAQQMQQQVVQAQAQATAQAQAQAQAQQEQLKTGQAQTAQATEQANAIAAQAAVSPEETIKKQYEAAQQIAQQEAQKSSDYAMQQQIKAGRTSGLSQGASALQAMQGAGQQYQAARADELARSRGYYSDALQRQLQGRLGAAGLYQGNAGQQYSLYDSSMNRAAGVQAQQSQQAFQQKQADQQRQDQFWNNIFGGLTTLGGFLLGSDKNMKTNIKENSLSDSLAKIKGYSYKYKGSSEPQAGIMAQDLEKGAMKPAVVNTPEGKIVDTRKLTTMNTGALAEHEKEIRSLKDEVQSLIKELGNIPDPKGKK